MKTQKQYDDVPFKSPLGDDKWTMSDERAFIENLLCQRFNFLLIFFGLVIAGAVVTTSHVLFYSLLFLGSVVTLILALSVMRSQQKLDYILDSNRSAICNGSSG